MTRPFLINVVVWGTHYVYKLAHYTIPTLLAPDNLPALVRRRPCEFVVVTPAGDVATLLSIPSFKDLSKIVPVKFIHLQDNFGNKYQRMTAGHAQVCDYGGPMGAYGVFLMPEMLIGNGSLLYLDESVRCGNQAVILWVCRVIEEEISDLSNYNPYCVSNRELVQIVFNHAHHEIRTFMVTNEEQFSRRPGFVIWPVPDKGVWIAHGIHIQPILVDLSNAQTSEFLHTIDAGNFVGASVPDFSKIDVVQDSDLAMMCSITPRNDIPTEHEFGLPIPSTIRGLVWGSRYVCDVHRQWFRKPIVYHAGDMPTGLEPYIEESNRFVEEVLRP